MSKGEKTLRLILSKISYLKEQLLMMDDIMSDAHEEFNKELIKTLPPESYPPKHTPCNEDPSEPPKPAPPGEDKDYELERVNKDPELKKLFKKIAQVIHPDKLIHSTPSEMEHKSAMFSAVRDAMEKDDYHFLYETAVKLGLKMPPPTEKHIKLLASTCEKLNNDIQEKQKTVAWTWYYSTKEEKDLLLRSYIEKFENSPRA